MDALTLFKTIIPTGYPYIQYVADTGSMARRGFWSRGIHVWDRLPTTGIPAFFVGPVPTENLRYAPNRLLTGKGFLEYDEVRAGLITQQKLLKHWQIAACGTYTDRLKSIVWGKNVFCARSGKDAFLLDVEKIVLINCDAIPVRADVTCFRLNQEFAETVKNSRLVNLHWYSDELKTLLGFESENIGGIVLSWDIKDNGKELLELPYQRKIMRFARTNNQIKLEIEMKCKEVPVTPGVTPKIPAIPDVGAKKPVEPKEPPTKAEGETPDLPGVPPKVEAPEAAPAPERTPAEVAEALSEAMKNLREQVSAAVKILKRGGASSEELKAMKAQVKELRAQLKEESDKRADAEKRDAASRSALKALVGSKDF